MVKLEIPKPNPWPFWWRLLLRYQKSARSPLPIVDRRVEWLEEKSKLGTRYYYVFQSVAWGYR